MAASTRLLRRVLSTNNRDSADDSANESSNEINPHDNGNQTGDSETPAATKLIKSLQFRNPGPKEEFDPKTSNREMRKVMRTSAAIGRKAKNKKRMVYNEQGLLQDSGRDLCDCLNKRCPGCHYPCPSCKSEKCGAECRCKRKWLYEQVEVEGVVGAVQKFRR